VKSTASHHQAIATPGKGLRVTAHADDGTVEGVEWTGDANWVVGVQWHPERMFGDAAAERLFADLVAAGRRSRNTGGTEELASSRREGAGNFSVLAF